MLPMLSEGRVTISNPPIVAEAGFVPWALSGTNITLRPVSPRSSWYALIIRTPANSPCAPARGARELAVMPVMLSKDSCSLYMSSRAPCTVSSGCNGWMPENPACEAITSLILGLYFIVQEPRG